MSRYLRPGLLATLLLLTVMAALYFHRQAPQVDHPIAIVGKHTFDVVLAETPQQQLDGLSGWTHLEPNQAMYFPLEGRYASFWMKDMLINIDIIWIDEGRVVGIDHRVPAPEVGVSDADLPSYPSPVESPDGVLEIVAGRSEELGIAVGDSFEIRPE